MLTKFVPYLKFAPYVGIALFALLAAVQYGNARHWEKRYIASEKVVVSYEAAQVAAMEINKARVAHIERQYAAISEKAESDYERRIADNRVALSEWMRSQASKGNTPSTGASKTAPVSSEVVPDTEAAIVPVRDLEIVADAYAQLDALIIWALEVGKVD
jgi:hypothetical protein